jgi:hypothetical protein
MMDTSTALLFFGMPFGVLALGILAAAIHTDAAERVKIRKGGFLVNRFGDRAAEAREMASDIVRLAGMPADVAMEAEAQGKARRQGSPAKPEQHAATEDDGLATSEQRSVEP